MKPDLRVLLYCCGSVAAVLLTCEFVSAGPARTVETNIAGLKLAADNGNPLAQLALGKLYAEGCGVPTNLTEAAGYFQRATCAGLPEAQHLLGLCYLYGKGVPKDHAAAAKWFRAAADQGFAGSQYELGLLYETRHALQQDFNEAVEWYRLAAGQGYALAQFSLGLCHASGRGSPRIMLRQ